MSNKVYHNTNDEMNISVATGRSRGLILPSGALTSFLRQSALVPVLIVVLIIGSVASPFFFTLNNIAGVGQQISALAVVVAGESLILLIGGMDLSLEATYGMAPMVAAWVILPIADYGNGWLLNPM